MAKECTGETGTELVLRGGDGGGGAHMVFPVDEVERAQSIPLPGEYQTLLVERQLEVRPVALEETTRCGMSLSLARKSRLPPLETLRFVQPSRQSQHEWLLENASPAEGHGFESFVFHLAEHPEIWRDGRFS